MNALDHKCPTCSAKLPFNPESQKWDCEYCGNSYTLDQLNNYEEENNQHADTELNVYKCPNCSANIISDTNTTATFCIYCGSTSIIKERLVGEFKPSKIIPFKTTKEEAIKSFKNFIKGKIFAPDNFTDEKNIQKITGVYIPFWTYNCSAQADLDFNAQKIKTWRSGNYRYTKTDYYLLKRAGNMDFEKVPVDGSRKFDDNTMDSIEPFLYEDLKDFNISYLSGFLSEKYDVNSDEASIRARERINNTIIDKLKSTTKYYNMVNLINSKIDIDTKKSEYVLLPVWMLNIEYNKIPYLFAMNGQTGKMIGNIPIDNKKFAITWIKRFFVYFLLVSIIIFIFMLLS